MINIIIIIILVWGFYEVSVSFIRSECFIIMAWVFSFFHYFLVCIVCCDLSHLVPTQWVVFLPFH